MQEKDIKKNSKYYKLFKPFFTEEGVDWDLILDTIHDIYGASGLKVDDALFDAVVKFPDDFDISHISPSMLSDKMVKKHAKILNWWGPSHHETGLDVNFILKYRKYLDMDEVSRCHDLTEEFLSECFNFINFNKIEYCSKKNSLVNESDVNYKFDCENLNCKLALLLKFSK